MSRPSVLKPPAPADVFGCCWTSVNSGGEECDCWEPVLATLGPVQGAAQEPIQEGPPCARRTACGDCAYRAGSPERAEQDGELPDYTAHDRFFCHDGMAFIIAWQHPSGAFALVDLSAGKADYHPLIGSDRAWRTDGRPAVLCAGWAAVNGVPRPNPAVSESTP